MINTRSTITRTGFRPAFAAILAMGVSSAGIAHAQSNVAAAGAQLPAAYPVSITPVVGPAGSHAFDAVAFNHVPLDLAAVGFHETEFFFSGLANAYQYQNPTNLADDRVVPVQAQPVPYVNRFLVRAPNDPARFSGNVILELGDDIAGSEDEVEWAHAHQQFIQNGDAYVTVTSLPTGVATLKTFNPTRYAALSWPTVAATQNACSDGPEPGIDFDQITSLGTLLKQNKANGPLPGLHVKRVFLTGYSGGAITLLTYDRVFGLNSPLFDGYFFDAGGPRRGINGCESLAQAAVRTAPPASTVSPVFQSQTESDIAFFTFLGAAPYKAQNSNTATDRYRYYEIAGAAHVDGDTIRSSPEASDLVNTPADPNPQAFTEPQFLAYCGQSSPTVITAFPNRYVDDALWANLERWAAQGTRYTPPTMATPLLIDQATYSGVQPQPGGVRSPAVDVPTTLYANGVGQPSVDPASPASACFLTGFQAPNGKALDPVGLVADAAKLAQQGFLTPYDLLDIAVNPKHAVTFPDGTTTIPDQSPSPASATASP